MKTWNFPPGRDACRRYVGLPKEGPYRELVILVGEFYPSP